MDRYLLLMLTDQPRRFRVIENIVRNKRTQANLFWGLNYHLLNWLGSDLHLTQPDFNQWLVWQQQQGRLSVEGDYAYLTGQGAVLKRSLVEKLYQPHNSQWSWLINSFRFADRFLLAIQAVSEVVHHHRHYVPLSIATTEMAAVRNWLVHLPSSTVVEAELQELGQFLANQDQRLAELFAHRLLGYQTVGWTNFQAQQKLGLSADEVQVLNWDVWLGVASQLKIHPQTSLGQLMDNLIATVPISSSAYQSLLDFQSGQTIQQIAQQRRLKISTVREHLLEAAIIVPQMLDWQRLLPAQLEQQIHQHYYGPAAEWQFERRGADSASDFFAFRLCQIKELHLQYGSNRDNFT